MGDRLARGAAFRRIEDIPPAQCLLVRRPKTYYRAKRFLVAQGVLETSDGDRIHLRIATWSPRLTGNGYPILWDNGKCAIFNRPRPGTSRGLSRLDGYTLGLEQGLVAGERGTVLMVLKARSVQVSESQRARIDACDDLATLKEWAEAALTIATADDLFR